MLLMSVRRHLKKVAVCCGYPGRYGAQGRNRTTDTVIFSHVLYQLSYLGIRVGTGDPEKRAAPLAFTFFPVHPLRVD